MEANPMNPKNPPSIAKAIKIPRSSNNRADLQKVNRPKTNQGSAELFKKGGDTMASKMNPGFMAMMAKKKDGMHKMPDGKMMKNSAMKMADGGMPMVMKDGKKVPAFAADGEGKMKHGGMAKSGMKKMAEGGKADMKQDKSMMQKAVNKHEGRLHKGASMTKLAKGGFTKEANGVAKRGLTKGTQVTMKKGGKC